MSNRAAVPWQLSPQIVHQINILLKTRVDMNLGKKLRPLWAWLSCHFAREQKVFFAGICVLQLNFTAISAHDISTFFAVCGF